MKGWISGLLLALPLACMAQNAEPTHQDFAYGAPLEVDGDGALYSFDLPADVYRYSTRLDLGDLRIFNGFGEVVPHLLKPGVRQTETKREPVDLRFFPLHEAAEGTTADTQVHIATDKDGAVVDFWQRGGAQQEEKVSRYLIDASSVDKPIEKLQFSWDETAEGFFESVSLEYSNDLTVWTPLVSRATLASLRYEDFSLGQSEIDLPPAAAKYYRMTWPLGKKGIMLRSVKAEIRQQGDAVPRHWLKLVPYGDETHRGVYEFKADGHYPIDRVKVTLPQANTVVRAKLYSRASAKDNPWRLRYQGLLYNLLREGHSLHNAPISLTAVSDPEWRLEIEMDGGGVGRGDPQLELGWVPHKLYFVARGESPFMLAFGAAGVLPSRSDLEPLLQTLNQTQKGNGFIKTAHPGSSYELGGERRLQPAPPPLPWKRWLLWSVLVLGVLMLALMARNLYRQMDDADRID